LSILHKNARLLCFSAIELAAIADCRHFFLPFSFFLSLLGRREEYDRGDHGRRDLAMMITESSCNMQYNAFDYFGNK
jgi:hypothetical protein